MGYYMTQREHDFFISKEYFPGVLAAIKELMTHEELMSGGNIHGARWFAFINDNNISEHIENGDIKSVFGDWRWDIEFDDEGNIDGIYFDGEKMGDDRYLFQIIAPFVKDNSYVEMEGEDGCLWRWVFKDGKCKEIYPEITWEE